MALFNPFRETQTAVAPAVADPRPLPGGGKTTTGAGVAAVVKSPSTIAVPNNFTKVHPAAGVFPRAIEQGFVGRGRNVGGAFPHRGRGAGGPRGGGGGNGGAGAPGRGGGFRGHGRARGGAGGFRGRGRGFDSNNERRRGGGDGPRHHPNALLGRNNDDAFAAPNNPTGQCEFQCEACERLFFSQADLTEHVALHVNCPHCKYSALQQLVDLHIKLVHDKHLASKVMEQSPEEIAEYLAERRRRFPKKQVSNDDEGQDATLCIEENRHAEGEGATKKGVIHENNVRGNKRGKFLNNVLRDHEAEVGSCTVQEGEQPQRSRQRKRRRNRASQAARREQPATPSQNADEDAAGSRVVEGVPHFRGLPQPSETASKKYRLNGTRNGNANGSEDNISDVDDFTPVPACQLPLVATKALTSLMACYSDSEDDHETQTVIPPKSARIGRPQEQCVLVKRPESASTLTGSVSALKSSRSVVAKPSQDRPAQETAGPLKQQSKRSALGLGVGQSVEAYIPEVAATLRRLVDRVVSLEEGQRVNRKQCRSVPPSASTDRRKLSLLEKLLAKDIRHERNILLQCVDFVVQNNFFDGMDYSV